MSKHWYSKSPFDLFLLRYNSPTVHYMVQVFLIQEIELKATQNRKHIIYLETLKCHTKLVY